MDFLSGVYEKNTGKEICIIDYVKVKSVINEFLVKVTIVQIYINLFSDIVLNIERY